MLEETANELDTIIKKKFDLLTRKAVVATEARERIIMLERNIAKEKEILKEFDDAYDHNVDVIIDMLLTSGAAEKIKKRQLGLGFIRGAPGHVMNVQSDALLRHINDLFENYSLEELHDRTNASSEGSTESTE